MAELKTKLQYAARAAKMTGTLMTKAMSIGLVSLLFILPPTIVVSDEGTSLKQIMQGLRDSLVEISDGLLKDDFEQVARGATAIAEHPRIPPEQVRIVAAELSDEMAKFKQFDTLVHDLSIEIRAAAKALDHNAVLSGYQRVLDGCVACHRDYKERVAAALSRSPSTTQK